MNKTKQNHTSDKFCTDKTCAENTCVCADRVLMWFEIKIIRICEPKGSMVKCSPSIIKEMSDFDYNAAKGFLVQHKTPKTLPCTVCVCVRRTRPMLRIEFLISCLHFIYKHTCIEFVSGINSTHPSVHVHRTVCMCSYKSFGLCIKIHAYVVKCNRSGRIDWQRWGENGSELDGYKSSLSRHIRFNRITDPVINNGRCIFLFR